MTTQGFTVTHARQAHFERKRRLKTPLDAESTNELQQVALAVVDLVDERVI